MRFRFGLLDRITTADGETLDLWSTCDALVPKALTTALADVLPVSSRCTHVKGHGGVKAAMRRILARLTGTAFLVRTDVKSYHAAIDHHRLLDGLAVQIKDCRTRTPARPARSRGAPGHSVR